MDCLELHQKSSDGQYWSNATLFLVSCQAHSFEMWSEIRAELFDFDKSESPSLSTMPFLSKKIKSKLKVNTLMKFKIMCKIARHM